jgi:TolB-like protein/Flp pilus assembly protein TadD
VLGEGADASPYRGERTLDQDPPRPDGHVFISYARPDKERVRPIVAALEAAGRRVWWDHHLEGGAVFAREIETALRDAAAVIVVWSQASVESDWVRDEAAVGRDRRRLVPIRLDDVAAPLGFRQYQAIRFDSWDGRPDSEAFQGLLRSLGQIPLRASEPAAAPSESRGPAARPSRRRLLVGAAVAIPAVGVGLWLGRGWLRPGASGPANSIAVLPFANLSGDPGQEYFSDGLTDELIDALASIPGLQVAGRISSASFKGSHAGPGEIARRLAVAALLDGSVRRDGDRVRISAELIDPASGFERWSKNYDHDAKDVLATQTSIAQAVAGELQVKLLGGDVARLQTGVTSVPAANDAYLKGMRLFDQGGGEAVYRQALDEFDAAVAADPQFAIAHAARARALVTLADEFSGPAAQQAAGAQALSAARQAVALAPDLAETQATLGNALYNVSLDFAGARAAYAKALAAGPGQAGVLARVGLFHCWVGDLDGGLAAVRRAATLDPLNPAAFAAQGRGLLAARRWPEAIASLRQTLALSPARNAVHCYIGDALLQQGDVAGALAQYALEPVAWLRLTGQAIALKRAGRVAEAEAALRALIEDRNDVAFYQQAQVFAQWGQPDKAFAALDEAVTARDGGLVLLNTDAMLDPIRQDPRLAILRRKLGLA